MDEIKKVLVRVKYERQTNWLKAEKLLLSGLQRFPDQIELMLELADLYFMHRQYRQAITVCQTGLLHSEDDHFIQIIANSFLSLKEYHIAINYYNRLENPTPEQLYNKSIALARIKRLDEAIQTILEVTYYNLKSPVPYILLAELHYNKNEYRKSVLYCDQAEKISGLSGEICFLRGMCWLAQKNLLKSYWDFHRGEIFEINNPDYYRSYGMVCEGIGKTQKAIELLQEAIKLAPDRPGSYLELFRIYLENKMLESATELLSKARNSLPGDFPLTMMYNQIIDGLSESHP